MLNQNLLAISSAPLFNKVYVFVDYWNFQLSLGQDFPIKWEGLGYWLAQRACETANIPEGRFSFEGMLVYSSYNPGGNREHYHWATTWLARLPGVSVKCLERQRRRPPVCQWCNAEIAACPQCSRSMVGTQEKGVDTLLATDMIRMAWEGAYDIAVLVTNDRDLAPCAEYLGQKAKKVIHAGIPPQGSALSSVCWASFNVAALRGEIQRAG